MTNDITEARCVAANSDKCYLLELPGELRNRIYHFATEQHHITFYSSRMKNYTNKERDMDGLQRLAFKPQFLNLVQASRQIHQEYAPIHAAEMSVRVCFLDLKEFMDANLPQLGRDTSGKIVGNLYIDYSYNEGHIVGYGDASVDLKALLQLCIDHQDLQMRSGALYCECLRNLNRGYGRACLLFKEDWCDVADDLPQLFDAARDRDLGAMLKEAVVTFTLDQDCQVYITFKKGKFEELVKTWYDAVGEDRHTWKKTGYVFSVRTLANIAYGEPAV